MAGFGRTGQNIATLLEEEQIPYRALDLDLERVARRKQPGRVFPMPMPHAGKALWQQAFIAHHP